MATIHHQQGKLTARRVVIGRDALRSSPFKSATESATFKCAGHTFSVIDKPTSALTDWVLGEIARGETAAAIPATFDRPKAVFFDMDATVIVEESLVEIARIAGKERLIEDITTRAMAGGMDFKESLRLRLHELKGVKRDDILTITPTINKGMPEFRDWAASHNIPMFLISGGFVELAEPVARSLGFRDFKANRFAWDSEGVMLGRSDGDIVDAEGKKTAVLNWCKHLAAGPEHCVTVGDGANDMAMMTATGMKVGFKPKPVLWPELLCGNHIGDHRFLIYCFS